MNNKNISFMTPSQDRFGPIININKKLKMIKEISLIESWILADLNLEKFENYVISADNNGITVKETKKALKHLVELNLIDEFYKIKPREVIKLMNKK
jgi:hypothetical protein